MAGTQPTEIKLDRMPNDELFKKVDGWLQQQKFEGTITGVDNIHGLASFLNTQLGTYYSDQCRTIWQGQQQGQGAREDVQTPERAQTNR